MSSSIPQNHQSWNSKDIFLYFSKIQNSTFNPEEKKRSQCVTVKSYKRKMNSDIHFKMGDGKTDIQCRRCCFCLDIHRILNLLLEAGHLWLVYFAECPVGNSGMRRVLGLPHRLSWQPPTKAQTEALSQLSRP